MHQAETTMAVTQQTTTTIPTGADLDQYNGRFAVTPEFPDGVYHYHATPGVYPYFVGPQFYGETNGDQIYSNSAKQIKPYLPNEIKPIDTHDVTVNGGTFSNVDDDFTYYYDAQTFINRYETRGSDQYFVDFNEALRIMVQTNASGSTASADTRSLCTSKTTTEISFQLLQQMLEKPTQLAQYQMLLLK